MSEYEDIIDDFFAQVRQILGTEALPELAAEQIERKLRSAWGGERVYIHAPDNGSRGTRILEEFNGTNRIELQKKYGISKAQFYRYLKGG